MVESLGVKFFGCETTWLIRGKVRLPAPSKAIAMSLLSARQRHQIRLCSLGQSGAFGWLAKAMPSMMTDTCQTTGGPKRWLGGKNVAPGRVRSNTRGHGGAGPSNDLHASRKKLHGLDSGFIGLAGKKHARDRPAEAHFARHTAILKCRNASYRSRPPSSRD